MTEQQSISDRRKIEWTLRIAMAGEYLGHGVFAWQLKPRFIEMLTAMTGIAGGTASTLMRLIGATDIVIAAIVILKPVRIVLVYATLWAFLTALARPIAGDPIWDFVERFANIGVPLALLFLRGLPKKRRDWFS